MRSRNLLGLDQTRGNQPGDIDRKGHRQPYYLDLQGIPPGGYTYLIKNGESLIKSGNFEINQSPVVQFVRPSPTGSEEYASLNGDSWDMAEEIDALVICAGYEFHSGKLLLTTPPAGLQPPGCDSGGISSDPRVFLNGPVPFNPSEYRYFSFRIYTEGAWQDVVGGMMARLIWEVPGSGRPAIRSARSSRWMSAGKPIPWTCLTILTVGR